MLMRICRKTSSLTLRSIYQSNRCLSVHQLNLNTATSTAAATVESTSVHDHDRHRHRNIQTPTISSKSECIDILAKTSTHIVSSLVNSSYMSNKSFWLYQLKAQLGTGINNQRELWHDLNKSIHLRQAIKFVDQDINQFTIKEKSTIFRIVSVMHNLAPGEDTFKLIQKLEADLYSHVFTCDLADLNNFEDGLNLFRTSRLHFVSRTLDHIVNLVKELAGKQTKEPSMDLFSVDSNNPMNQINQQWIETHNQKNDLLFGMYVLQKLKNFIGNKNLIAKNMLRNEYVSEKLLTQGSEDIEEKLAIHNFFQHFGYEKQFDRLALTDNHSFYAQLAEKDQIDSLKRLAGNPSLQKYFVRNILVKYWTLNRDAKTSDTFKMLVEHFAIKLKETRNIYDYQTYLSCISELFYSNLNAKRGDDFKAFANKYNRMFDHFITSEKTTEMDTFQPRSQKKPTDPFYSEKFECRKVAQENVKKFRKTDLDLHLSKRFVDLKRFGEPFYWVSNKLVLNLIYHIEDNFSIYFFNEQETVLDVLERVSSSYNEVQLPLTILNTLYYKLTEGSIFKKENKVAILKIILRDYEFCSKRFQKLCPIINEILDNQCSISTAAELFKSMNNNLDVYVAKHPKETNQIINKIVKLVSEELSDINQKNTTKDNTDRNIDDIIKRLFQNKNKIEFEKFNINLNKLKSKKNEMINAINQISLSANQTADVNIDAEVKRFENFFFFYSLKLKSLVDLMVLNNQYDKELFCEIMNSCIQILTIFEKAIFSYKKYDPKNKTENFFKKKGFILDLLTCYGLFNYFDVKHLLNTLDDAESKLFRENHIKLEEINASNYYILRNYLKNNTFKLMKYSFGMLNLNIVNSEALADLFQSNITVKEICEKIQLEKKGDIIFCSKLMYAINTISKCRNFPVPWLFENYSTRLPEKKQQYLFSRDKNIIYNDLVEMFGSDYVKEYPVYEYNLISDFELATNEAGDMVKPTETDQVKLRIPIYVLNDSMTYKNSSDVLSSVSSYIECLKQFHPVVLINQAELKDSIQERQEYLFKKMQSSIVEYLNQKKN